MKNADMPISFVDDNDPDFVEQCRPMSGLTKREYFAVNLHIESDSVSFRNAEMMESFIGRSINVDDLSDMVKAQAEVLAKVRVVAADAILEELERTK